LILKDWPVVKKEPHPNELGLGAGGWGLEISLVTLRNLDLLD
jgi:hypothetical protein